MKKLFYIFFIINLLSSSKATAEENKYIGNFVGPVPTSYQHIKHAKIDSTGGLQLPGGVQMMLPLKLGPKDILTSRKMLDPKRGPDILGSCGYFRSSFVTEYDEGSGANIVWGNYVCSQIRGYVLGLPGGGGLGE